MSSSESKPNTSSLNSVDDDAVSGSSNNGTTGPLFNLHPSNVFPPSSVSPAYRSPSSRPPTDPPSSQPTTDPSSSQPPTDPSEPAKASKYSVGHLFLYFNLFIHIYTGVLFASLLLRLRSYSADLDMADSDDSDSAFGPTYSSD
jgi:hypothetical protein